MRLREGGNINALLKESRTIQETLPLDIMTEFRQFRLNLSNKWKQEM